MVNVSFSCCSKNMMGDIYSLKIRGKRKENIYLLSNVIIHVCLLWVCWTLQWPASRGFQQCLWWLTSTSPWRVVKAWSTGPGTLKIRSSSRKVSLSPSQQVRAEPSCLHNAWIVSVFLHPEPAHNTEPKIPIGSPWEMSVIFCPLWPLVQVKTSNVTSLSTKLALLPALVPFCVDSAFSACSPSPGHSTAYCTAHTGAKPFG